MAHYALLDENNVVVNVIVGAEENSDGINWEKRYSSMFGLRCLRTSINTINGKHIAGGSPFRGNYAGIGYSYNRSLNAFIPPKPYPSWIIDKKEYNWMAPVPYPENGQQYCWNEEILNWELEENV